MTFIREIPTERITDAIIKDYEARGFTIIWKEDSVEIWVE